MNDNRFDLIKENEEPLICCWCVHKWHYENHNKLNEAFNDNKFGFHTLVTFYPSGVWLTNNFHNATELDEKGIEWSKQVSYSDFAEMMCNGNIENQHLYDWDDDV